MQPVFSPIDHRGAPSHGRTQVGSSYGAKNRSSYSSMSTHLDKIPTTPTIPSEVVNKWLLRFYEPILERNYRGYVWDRAAWVVRIVFILTMVVVPIFSVLQFFPAGAYSHQLEMALILQLCLVVPTVALGLLLTFWKSARLFLPFVTCVLMLVIFFSTLGGIFILGQVSLDAVSLEFYTLVLLQGLILAFLFATFAYLPFLLSAVSGAVVAACAIGCWPGGILGLSCSVGNSCSTSLWSSSPSQYLS